MHNFLLQCQCQHFEKIMRHPYVPHLVIEIFVLIKLQNIRTLPKTRNGRNPSNDAMYRFLAFNFVTSQNHRANCLLFWEYLTYSDVYTELVLLAPPFLRLCLGHFYHLLMRRQYSDVTGLGLLGCATLCILRFESRGISSIFLKRGLPANCLQWTRTPHSSLGTDLCEF